MSIIVIIVIAVAVVIGGLWPAFAGELRARRRDARALAWTAAQAKGQADQAAWARDRAKEAQERAWAAYSPNGGAAARIRWEQTQASAQASARAAWDASQEATKSETRAKEAQKRVSLKSIMIEAIQDLKG